MSDEHTKRAPVWLALALTAFVLLPCVYIASIGPVARFATASLSGFWGVFYAPLDWAHRHTFLRAPLEWYVGVWIELIPGHGD